MSNRLYVGNLSFHTNKDALLSAFSGSGREVTDVHVVTDRDSGQSRGFGFVTLASADMARAAQQELDGAILDGRPLRVNEAEAKPTRTGGGGGGARRDRY
jgi:RNA recognition motif-containing protein